MNEGPQRKIIHIDMDCFYDAIEIRDNPSLADKPVAVGGTAEQRSVLCTCNYIAREYGVRSAMPTAYAERLCKDLIVLPVNMSKYKEAAKIIHSIFAEYTHLVEPLSLDEAYLDVSGSTLFNGSATLIANEIRQRILEKIKITASAGVAPNKFLAKIASGWKKPNGLFVIPPKDVANFIEHLPVKKLFGVGKVTAKKLNDLGFVTCADLHEVSLTELTTQFGKFGLQLYEQSRGIDNRPVEPNRTRKSLSVEQTFHKDIHNTEQCIAVINELYQRLMNRLKNCDSELKIKNQYLKIKYSNFKLTTIEKISSTPSLDQYYNLLAEIGLNPTCSIRLLGLGVHFQLPQRQQPIQHKLL